MISAQRKFSTVWHGPVQLLDKLKVLGLGVEIEKVERVRVLPRFFQEI